MGILFGYDLGITASVSVGAVIGAILSARTNRRLGRRYVFEDQSVHQAYATRTGLDATREQVDGWISWYLAIANGEVAIANGEVALVTDDVARLTGRRPALSIGDSLGATAR